MITELEILKLKVQDLLGKQIVQFNLKGKGSVNYAYYIESADNEKYIVKQERKDKEFQPQNDLHVEAKVAKKLLELNLTIPTSKVIFICKDPLMYGYEYVDGSLMQEAWSDLSEDERINVFSQLGHFTAEIGKKFTPEMAGQTGIMINTSPNLHSEVLADYERLIQDPDVPEHFIALAKEAKSIFDQAQGSLVFQFLHNDSHHENTIIKEGMISGIIDFGEAEYGEVAKEFSRHIRDYPNYFHHMVSAYEKTSGKQLSYERLVSNALLSGFIDIVEDYQKGGESQEKAEGAILTYKRLLGAISSGN